MDEKTSLALTSQSKKFSYDTNRSRLVVKVKTPADIASIISGLNIGQVTRYCELRDQILDTDLEMASVISTRLDRVISNKWEVLPATTDRDDMLAAEFCTEALNGITDLNQRFLSIADAIPLGFSAHEIEWKYRNGNFVIGDLIYVNQRRFIYSPTWELRLYDYGMRGGSYGEELIKNKWVVHTSSERQGDPCMYGLIRTLAYIFIFRHYHVKFWCSYSERFGVPHIVVYVDKNTPKSVIDEIQHALDNFSYDHTMVVKEGSRVEVNDSSSTPTVDGFERFLKWSTDQIVKYVLGSSDVNSAGDVGSLAAVASRTSSTVDPKRDRDALCLASTIQRSIFRPLIDFNSHLFFKRPSEPIFRFIYDTGNAAATAPEAGYRAILAKDIETVRPAKKR